MPEADESANLVGAYRLFLGALGQGLSDNAAVRHAAWWGGVDKGQLGWLIRKLFPDGFDKEREAQVQSFRSHRGLRSRIYNDIDRYYSRVGTSDETAMTLFSGLTVAYENENKRIVHGCFYDRSLYWSKKRRFHVFVAGRAWPIIELPAYQTVPLPAGMTLWNL